MRTIDDVVRRVIRHRFGRGDRHRVHRPDVLVGAVGDAERMRLAAGSYWGVMSSVVRLPSRSTTTFAGVVALQPAVGVPAHAWRLTTRRRRSWRSMICWLAQASAR